MHTRRSERGAALYVAVAATVVLLGISVAMATVSLATRREYEAAHFHMQRLYAAEAGLSHALLELTQGGDGAVGTSSTPTPLGAGSYFTTAVDNGDGTLRITSTGSVGGDARAVEALVTEMGGGVFHNALFAGNSSGDPDYSLDLGGSGSQADSITGDVFSGGGIDVTGDATITGEVSASGTITGLAGTTGESQPIPNIAAMNYDTIHDVNVAQQFTDGGTWTSDALGGSAWQLPSSYEAHIFRKNPDDRSTENSSTTKDDYYLEDPYEAVSGGSGTDEDSATRISVSRPGPDGVDGNAKVYFIDGNLWLHNRSVYTFMFESATGSDDARVTFVVKGNIYFSDNLVLQKPNTDGIAFIAIKDSALTDSGNIYFGDSVFGTLDRMDGFMYAENDFYDTNLSASGSSNVQVNGIMSAGNHIAIQRDYGGNHTQLELNFDSRIKDGTLELPGLPAQGIGLSRRTYRVLMSIEVAADE